MHCGGEKRHYGVGMTTSTSPKPPTDDTPARGIALGAAVSTPAEPVADAGGSAETGVPADAHHPAAAQQPVAEQVVEPAVTAVVVTKGLTRYLPGLLSSITAQTVLPREVVIVDVSSTGPLTLPPEFANDPRTLFTVVPAQRAKTFGQGVNVALRKVPGAGDSPLLWLLHDDTAAQPSTLEKLLFVVRNSATVAIAGPKQVRLGAEKDLLHVGYSVAMGGQRLSGVELSEFDQGQHDAREDVFAVSLNGALVRNSLWIELRGTDPTYGRYGDSLDFCRRARLAGHRVLVVPGAVIGHAQASLTGARDTEDGAIVAKPSLLDDRQDNHTYFARLRSSLYYSATSYPPLLVPGIWLLALLAAPFRALFRVATKQPRQAVAELMAPIWLFTKLGNALGATIRMSLIKAVPRSTLRELMISQRQVWSHRRDLSLARSTLRRQLYGPSELDEEEFRQVARRRRTLLVTLVALLSATTLAAFWDLLPGFNGAKRIVGGALAPAQATFGDLWQSWTGGWVRDGLGASAPADPLVFSLLPGSLVAGANVQLAVNLTVLLALLLSGLGAWFAAGAVTRALPVRAWATLLWVAAPSLLVGLGQGRLGAIIAHAVLPWFVLTLVRAFGLQAEDQRSRLRYRQQLEADEALEEKLARTRNQEIGLDPNEPIGAGTDLDPNAGAEGCGPAVPAAADSQRPQVSLAALGGSALLFALIVTGAPVLLIPGLLALVLLAFVVPRARFLLAVPIPAIALMGPLLVRAFVNRDFSGWRILFADPGVPVGYETAAPWQLLLGLPTAIPAPNFVTGIWPAMLAILALSFGAVVLVGATVGLVRSGNRSKVVRVLWLIALLGLVTALVSSRVIVANGPTQAITGWSGSGLSLMVLALLGAAVLGFTGVSAKAGAFNFGWRQVVLGLATFLVFLIPLSVLATWSIGRATGNELLAPQASQLRVLDHSVVPAVAQQMQNSGRQARVLAISPAGLDGVTYQLFHRDGSQLLETSTVVNFSHLSGRPDDIANLVAHIARGLEPEGEQPTAFQLGAMGIGSILVPAGPGEDVANLVARLDTIAGLQRVTENVTGTLWRVQPQEIIADVAALEGQLSGVEGDRINAVIVPGEPVWAAIYDATTPTLYENAQPLAATRLAVNTQIDPGAADRVVIIAENAAPGWTARLDGVTLSRVEINGMQGFDLSNFADMGGRLEISYERATQLPWLILQGTVVVVFGLLALPLRRRGLR